MLVGKLTEKRIAKAYRPGLLNDGGGLYLNIAKGGSKSWVFRFSLNCRQRRMGLGSVDTLNLQEARESARECRKLISQGIDPIEHRRDERAVAARSRAMSVRDAALAYIQTRESGWTAEYARQWRSEFETYVFPKIGGLPINAGNVTDIILRVIEPLWATKTQTAWRIRAMLERVINWAKFRGYCTGENAARWKGHLEFQLQHPSKIRGVKHHAALPYRDLPSFMQKLATRPGIGAEALAFTILTNARQKETRFAPWDEFDLEARIWTVPAARMKMQREHCVPLNEPALAILREMARSKTGDSDLVFQGTNPARPIGENVMKNVMTDMGYKGIATPHGFRSSFKDWATEETDFRTEAIELALAHAVGSKVEAAYRRGNLLEQRRLLSEAWGKFCLSLCLLLDAEHSELGAGTTG
jgi:integrase